MAFKKATKAQARLRLALIGPAGSGKTYTSLALATALGARVALIDTEHGSASKYSDVFAFDSQELEDFHPERYIEALKEAERERYDVLVIDSLSHAWDGKGGALELVDRAAKRQQSANTFAAWRDVTPIHRSLVEALVGCRCHLIVTMRAKTEYVLETNEKGKQVPRKVGLAPIQREGLDYEFDVVGDLSLDNVLCITKTRCPSLNGEIYRKPGADFAKTLLTWLSDGASPAAPKKDEYEEVSPAPTLAEKLYSAICCAPETKKLNELAKIVASAHKKGDLTEEELGHLKTAVLERREELKSAPVEVAPAKALPEPGSDEDELFSDPTPRETPEAPVLEVVKAESAPPEPPKKAKKKAKALTEQEYLEQFAAWQKSVRGTVKRMQTGAYEIAVDTMLRAKTAAELKRFAETGEDFKALRENEGFQNLLDLRISYLEQLESAGV